MGALAGRAILSDEIVKRRLIDAVIDCAHDDAPDGDVRDAARLSDRLHVDMPPLPPLSATVIASAAVGSGFAPLALDSRASPGGGPIPVRPRGKPERAGALS